MKERKNFIVRVEPKTTNIKGQQTKRKVTGQTLDHHLKPLLAPPSDPDLINLVQATENKRSSKNKDYTRPVEIFRYQSLNIRELLTKINAAQLKGKLSESEFRSALLNGTTGKDHLLVQGV